VTLEAGDLPQNNRYQYISHLIHATSVRKWIVVGYIVEEDTFAITRDTATRLIPFPKLSTAGRSVPPLVMPLTFAKTVLMPRDRIVGPDSSGVEEEKFNYALRPERFGQYVGQESLIRKLRIAVEAARSRKEPVDHTLLHGPPGLSKSTSPSTRVPTPAR
jgi:hypothetical protein